MKKRMAIFLTLAFLATSANGQTYYYLNDGGTSSGGAWDTTPAVTGTIGENTQLWLEGEDSEPTAAMTSTHTFNGGTYSSNTLGVGRYARNTSTVTLTNGTTLNISVQNGNNMLWVGREGKGRLNIEDSSVVNVGNGVFVGYITGGNGTITIKGTGSQLNVTGGNSLWLGGFNASTQADKSGTVNVETGGTLSVTNGIHVGDGGAGNLNVTGGTVKTSELLVGYYNSANTPGKGTFTLTSGSATLTGAMHIGNGTATIDGGTFSATGGTSVYRGGTLNVTGGTFGGALTLNPGGTVQWGISGEKYVTASGLTSAANAGNVEVMNNAGRIAFNETKYPYHVNITRLNGEVYFNASGDANRGHAYLTSVNTGQGLATDVTYGGYIDGGAWPVLHVNVGTAEAPVTIDWAVAGKAGTRYARYQASQVKIGEGTATGYVTVANGLLDTRLITLGENAGSSGTLEVKAGGVLGQRPYNSDTIYGYYTINVGTSEGKGMLYLNGGRVQVTYGTNIDGEMVYGAINIGDNGTLRLGTNVTDAIPEGADVQVSAGGVVEVVAGSWGASLSRITNNGTLHVNGGTVANNYTVTVGGTNANCNILRYTTGTISNNPVLAGGLLVVDWSGNSFQDLNLAEESTGGRVQILNANSGVGIRGTSVAANIILEANRGKLHFYTNNRGHVEFVSTQSDGVVYGGAIDGNAWPTAGVNVGTATDPVVMETYQVGASDNIRNDYRLKKLSIGQNGATGYLEFTDGILRAGIDSNGTGGIVLGDNNAESHGTLALTGGSILAHFNSGDGNGYNLHNDILVGTSAGTGRLILAGGKMADNRVHVAVGANGTVEIANGAYTWGDLRLTNYDGSKKEMNGAMEVTGGSLDLQGNSATFSKLNAESQYNTTSAPGTLTNSSTTTSTVTLNNTTAGAYEKYSISGNIGVTFGAAGLAETIVSKNGTINTTQSLTILSDTELENVAVDVSEVNLSNRLSIAWDDFKTDSLVIHPGGILDTTFDLENSLPLSLDSASIAGTIDVAWEGEWDGTLFYTLFTSEDVIDWLEGSVVNAPTGFRALMLDNALVLGHASAVPEPSTWLLLALGGLMLWVWRRKRLP
ncbi:MAG: PEP-CTERM sorting domain-containing protein [Planctomycetia bacterium]|nr:PEP-CTERM sorting domain-containing protein [Planctomycetia bacterium]